MDELKQRILSLINKQGPKIPSMGFSDSNYHNFPQMEATLSINSKTVADSDRPADQDILESIEAAYFAVDSDYDICRFELSKLPEVLECDQIQRDFKNLKQQHQVVSKKVLQLILEHQSGCNGEFEKVLDVLEEVGNSLEVCQTGRRELRVAGDQFKDCLRILGNYRKRKLAQNLLDNLKTIRELQCFETRLQDLLRDEDYAGAIIELKRCHKLATDYRHFNCVAALTYKLQETLDNTDGQLDRVLAQTCYHFDPERHKKLLRAYTLLDKSETTMIDNLHVHYITAIYNSTVNVIGSYVASLDTSETSGCSKNPFKAMCQNVAPDQFIPCLINLCQVLFKILSSYHNLSRWHSESTLTRQKLEHNLTKIWDDVQRKVSCLLLNSDLSAYKFDQFVQVLGVVHRLMQVGDEFCHGGSAKSEDLQESIRRQSVNYFQSYHEQRLDELRIFLENEMWEVCPVKDTFTILQLQEFKSLRTVLKNYSGDNVRHSPHSNQSTDCCSTASTHSQDCNYLIRYKDSGTPFDSGLDETIIEEDILDGSGYYSDDSEEAEELRRDFVDEEETGGRVVHGHRTKHKSLVTNTTLTVLRQMGKYLQMSRLLKPIAYQVISCMNQLFDFYLYSVHSFFTSDLTIATNALYSDELAVTLKKIKDNLMSRTNHVDVSGGGDVTTSSLDESQATCVVTDPAISPMVDLRNPETLHGLGERIVGVESVVFLAKQFEFLRDFLEHLVPPNNKIMLQQFFGQNIASAPSLRKPVYMAVVAQAFDLRTILVQMSRVNWEVKDVMSQHNSYIDTILREVHIFTMRLEQVASKVSIGQNEIGHALWEGIAHIITHTLVQGEAKKCSNGGRALMQLDFIQFLSKFEKIANLRPVPHKEYVENYVKAYYLPEMELEKWIRDNHGLYTSKHLFGLVSCACQNNKKTRQRLLQVIDDREKEQMTVTAL